MRLWTWVFIVCVLVSGAGVVGGQQESPIDVLALNASGESAAITYLNFPGLVIWKSDTDEYKRFEDISADVVVWHPVDADRFAVLSYGIGVILYRFQWEEGLIKEHTFRFPYPSNLVWSLDGTRIAISHDSSPEILAGITIWDTTTGQQLARYEEQNPTLASMVWRPQYPDQILFTVSNPQYQRINYIVWDTKRDVVIEEVNYEGSTSHEIAWNAEGEQFVSLQKQECVLSIYNVKENITFVSSHALDLFPWCAENIVWHPFDRVLIMMPGFAVIDMKILRVISSQYDARWPVSVNSKGMIAYDNDGIKILDDVGLEPVVTPSEEQIP